MKKLTYMIMGVALVSLDGIAYSYSISFNPVLTSEAQMIENSGMSGMTQMMSQIPEDVIIKVHSPQTVYLGLISK